MQTLFEGSDENPGMAGLGVLPGKVARWPVEKQTLEAKRPYIEYVMYGTQHIYIVYAVYI